MGLFMDHDGIPLAFDIYPGNRNEQPTLKPLEKKIIGEYGLDHVIVCTDAGLSSAASRKFNDRDLPDGRTKRFLTTQSIKTLPDLLKDFALGTEDWHLIGDDKVYSLNDLNEEDDYNKVFYKER